MSCLRTLVVLTCLVFPAGAMAQDLVQRIAQCTGRMSAEMEFAWLNGEAGEQARLYRSHLEDVLDAIISPTEQAAVLHMRIEAKFAHARLLTRAMFNDDPVDADTAARLASRFTGSCRAILTG